MYSKSRSIIIKNMDFRDADKLVTLFSEKEGKIRAIAKGIKKPNSSLRACVQPFAHSFLFFSSGRELGIITQGQVLDFYSYIRDDINLSLNITYLMELLDKSLLENVPFPRLYQTTLQVLDTLNQADAAYNPLIFRYYEMALLKELGYKPVVERCVICGKSDGDINYLSISEGGTVCTVCSPQSGHNLTVSKESLAILKLLAAANITTLTRVKASANTLKQIELILERYLEYHLERKFKVKDTIKRLKKRLSVPN